MSNNRMNQVCIAIGRRGSGKTYFTNKLMKAERKKILVIDTLDHPAYKQYQIITPELLPRWKSGTKRLLVNESNFNEVMQWVRDYVRNAFVVFEDAGKYIIEKIPENLRVFVLDTKQINVDVLFLYHGFGDVVPRLFRYADNLTIFKVNEQINTYKYKIPCFGLVSAVYAQVMNSPDPHKNITVKIN